MYQLRLGPLSSSGPNYCRCRHHHHGLHCWWTRQDASTRVDQWIKLVFWWSNMAQSEQAMVTDANRSPSAIARSKCQWCLQGKELKKIGELILVAMVAVVIVLKGGGCVKSYLVIILIIFVIWAHIMCPLTSTPSSWTSLDQVHWGQVRSGPGPNLDLIFKTHIEKKIKIKIKILCNLSRPHPTPLSLSNVVPPTTILSPFHPSLSTDRRGLLPMYQYATKQ